MAMKIKTPTRRAPEDSRPPATPSRQQQQAANRPEYESQVPGLIDRQLAEALGFPGETMRMDRQTQSSSRRIPVPTELKRKTKVKAKRKAGDVYTDGKRTGKNVLP